VASAHAFVISSLALAAQALRLPTAPTPARGAARREVLAGGALAWAAGALPAAAEEETSPPPPPPPPPLSPSVLTTKSGLKYSVVKEGGKSSLPVVGDLIAIRFKCTIEKTGAVIDDILNSAEPYYYRVGSGQVVPAVEEAVLMMRAGDVWELTVPPALGFGTKGRSSSPGKPRISGDAVLKFTLALDAVPGKDEEIVEMNGVID